VTPELRTGLRGLVRALSGHPCVWRDEPRPFASAGAIALLEARSHRRIGQGLDVETTGELADEQTNATIEFELSILLESFSHTIHAQDVLIALRSRLDRHWTLAVLEGLDACVVEVAQVTVLGTKYDDRIRSCASIDLRIRAMLTESQAAFDALIGAATAPSVIDAVELEGETIGTPLPDPEEEEEEDG